MNLTPKEREEEIKGFVEKKTWPLYPLLPVKNLNRQRGGEGLGVCFAGDAKPTVYKDADPWTLGATPMFVERDSPIKGLKAVELKPVPSPLTDEQLRTALSKFEKLEFNSWEELVDAGWIGD